MSDEVKKTPTKKVPEGMHVVAEHEVKAHTAKNPDDHDPKTVEGTHKVKAHDVKEHLAKNPDLDHNGIPGVQHDGDKKPAAKAATASKAVATKPAAGKVAAKPAAKTSAKPGAKAPSKPAAKTAPAAPKAAPKVAATDKKAAPKRGAKKVEEVKDGERTSNRKVMQGTVVSNKMDKTAVVAVITKTAHPLYKKVVTRTKKFKVHDEYNECSIGDKVEIMETRPLSRDKYFRLVRIVEKVR